ncbi:hypothetical protein BC936DRAFT_147785 [Jimgerdemannia flammicorona]|uniref:Uncharacterized protein n=1 Tax=Jimgerdemannia flammicorona TaxID=994334 RepID=A0A433D4K2_9FUNG|nr:hypothetical protein BC936DRAFT_147785 [Jimgerdemannia flammicorona]
MVAAFPLGGRSERDGGESSGGGGGGVAVLIELFGVQVLFVIVVMRGWRELVILVRVARGDILKCNSRSLPVPLPPLPHRSPHRSPPNPPPPALPASSNPAPPSTVRLPLPPPPPPPQTRNRSRFHAPASEPHTSEPPPSQSPQHLRRSHPRTLPASPARARGRWSCHPPARAVAAPPPRRSRLRPPPPHSRPPRSRRLSPRRCRRGRVRPESLGSGAAKRHAHDSPGAWSPRWRPSRGGEGRGGYAVGGWVGSGEINEIAWNGSVRGLRANRLKNAYQWGENGDVGNPVIAQIEVFEVREVGIGKGLEAVRNLVVGKGELRCVKDQVQGGASWPNNYRVRTDSPRLDHARAKCRFPTQTTSKLIPLKTSPPDATGTRRASSQTP